MLTAERINEVLAYDPCNGYLTWKVDKGRNRSGHRAGSIKMFRGRVMRRDVTIDQKSYKEHRVILLMVTGQWPDGEVDHINGDTTDNRIDNLRVVNSSDNSRNTKTRSTNTSGVMGVSLHKRSGKFHANIQHGGRQVYLGSFASFDDAVSARKDGERRYGYHANHGR